MTAALERHSPNVTLVCGGLQQHRLRLQPWHYFMAVASQLRRRGCRVTIISDVATGWDNASIYDNLTIQRVPSISNPRWRNNHRLQQAIEASDPEAILWHLGAASFLHQRFASSGGCPVVGICTSPIYTRSELARIGWIRLLRSWRLSGIQLLTAFTPSTLFNGMAERNPQMDLLVVQTETTKQALARRQLWRKEIRVIPPAAGDCWQQRPEASRRESVRKQLGFNPKDTVLVYFGSPAPIRGLQTLIEALGLLLPCHPHLRLLVLSRRTTGEFHQKDYRLRQLVRSLSAEGKIVFIDGMLDEGVLRDYVAASDVVTLPFALITSDAPISILEAQALAKPIVSAATGCVPELIGVNHPGLVRGADAAALARTVDKLCARVDEQVGSTLLCQEKLDGKRTWQDAGEEWMRLLCELL